MPSPPFISAEAVELAFYHAFENNDFAAMQQVWDDAEDIACIHPMAQILHGRRAVMASWRDMLSGGVGMRFTLEPVQIYRVENLTIHLLNEHIAVVNGNRVAPMVATNIFRLGAQGWRMVLHHASPNPGSQTENTHARLH